VQRPRGAQRQRRIDQQEGQHDADRQKDAPVPQHPPPAGVAPQPGGQTQDRRQRRRRADPQQRQVAQLEEQAVRRLHRRVAVDAVAAVLGDEEPHLAQEVPQAQHGPRRADHAGQRCGQPCRQDKPELPPRPGAPQQDQPDQQRHNPGHDHLKAAGGRQTHRRRAEGQPGDRAAGA